jgi:GTP-binding protein
MFRDEAEIYVKAGDGGNGKISFRREAKAPRGGPDGGNGGYGGDVIFQVSHNCKTLLDLVRQREYNAGNGEHGGKKDCTGKSGKPLIIRIPPGTLIKDEKGTLLADMKTVDEEFIVVRGGKGGFGNAHFANSINQAPRIAEKGEPGEEKHLFLELKLIADVGLVGFPNAGKSTLIARISSAHPKIAPYPFTTLEPHLGIVEMSGFRRFVVADLPGLIEGAHEGVGLGHKFLRHIERTKVLLYLLDIAPGDNSSPAANFAVLCKELRLHSAILAAKSFMVVANKMDLTDAEENLALLRQELQMPVIPISAATGQGLPQLLEAIAALVAREAEEFAQKPPQEREKELRDNDDEKAPSQ